MEPAALLIRLNFIKDAGEFMIKNSIYKILSLDQKKKFY